MVLEGQGRFWEHTKEKMILYIPTDIYKDSQFPFKPKEQVKITIEAAKKKDNSRKGIIKLLVYTFNRWFWVF